MDIVFLILSTSPSKPDSRREVGSVANIAGFLKEPAEVEKFGMIFCACHSFGLGFILRLIKALQEKGNNVLAAVPAPMKLMK